MTSQPATKNPLVEQMAIQRSPMAAVPSYQAALVPAYGLSPASNPNNSPAPSATAQANAAKNSTKRKRRTDDGFGGSVELDPSHMSPDAPFSELGDIQLEYMKSQMQAKAAMSGRKVELQHLVDGLYRITYVMSDGDYKEESRELVRRDE